MKMLDYVVLANKRLRENLQRESDLVVPLVSRFCGAGYGALRIVASGSSRHAAECARPYMERTLGMPVEVITPESYCRGVSPSPLRALNIAVSQSGYSTNTIRALDVMAERGDDCVALTGNLDTPLCEHVDTALDYGVGIESVDFVTMGVLTLIEYLLLFSVRSAHGLGRLSDEDLGQAHADILQALDAHERMLEIANEYATGRMLALSRPAPVVVVGNGPNLGVAQETALKVMETLKYPAMWFEGEEFIHGPELQITPDYHIVILDDPEGSERLAKTARLLSHVSESVCFVTSNPRGDAWELVVPRLTDPLLCSIPNLALPQTVAALLTEVLGRWEKHALLARVLDEFDSKAAGYEESVRHLEQDAAKEYGDAAGSKTASR